MRAIGRTIRLTLTLVLGLGLPACAGAPATPGAPDPAEERSVIGRGELAGHDDTSALQAIRRLRPNWLRARGQTTLESPEREGLRVYLDGAYFGDAGALGSIQVRTVEELRFLDARQATLRFGTGHTVGAILVVTRR